MLCKLLKLEKKEVDEELEHANEINNNRKKYQIIKNDVLEKIINFYIEIIYNFLNVKNNSSERYLHNYLYTYITSTCRTKIGTEDKISGHSGHYYLKIGNESFATFKPLFMAMVHSELLTQQRLEQIIAYHIKAKIKEYINATETKNYFFYLIFENKELKAAIKEKTARVIDEMLEEMNLDSYFIQKGHPAITVMNNSEYESYEELPEALQKVLNSKFIENLEITCKELFPDFEIREFEGRNIWLVYGREPDILDFQLNFGNDRKMALLKYELWQKMKYPLYPIKLTENQENLEALKEKFQEITKTNNPINNLRFFQTGMQTLKMRDFLDNLAVAKYCTEYNIFYLIP